jgi:glycosyltransferase involved in cell wall biosynthesis
MIIGFDGSRAFVKGRTGTENYSYQLLLHLAQIDNKNEYLVYLRPGSRVEGEWPSNFKFKILNFKRLWTQLGLSKATFQDPLDILFVPAHTLPMVIRKGLKTVMTVHDLGAEYLPQMHQLKQRAYLNWMTHTQLKNATKLIAVSEATKKDIIKKVGVDPKRIEVIYEGVNLEVFKPVKEDTLVNALSKFDINIGSYFLFIGTIQPRKNLERLIEAYDSYYGPFNEVPKLVLAGNKGWLSDDIYKLVELLDLTEKVKFLGRVSDEELASLYSGAIALVYPSLFEGFGLPILEAQACECPVVTSNISSLPEIAGDSAILVDPYDINSISWGMEQFLKRTSKEDKDYSKTVIFEANGTKRKEFIKRGLTNIKRFSWEKAARETLELFENL